MNNRLTSIGIVCMLVIGGFIGLLNLGSRSVQGVPISGTITSDTVWDPMFNPYIIVGDVTVAKNVTLSIMPGVWVKFDGYYSISVEGDLEAVGTVASRITITSNMGTPSPGDWQRIQINSTGHADFINCDIMYGRYAIVLWGSSNNSIMYNYIMNHYTDGIWLESSSNNNITGNVLWNHDYGIRLVSSNGNIIMDNSISSSDFDGGQLWASSNNTIINNDISSSGGIGIRLYISSNNNILEDNILSSNNRGISLYESSNNSITGNTAFTNGFSGIQLYEYSNHNTITGNDISSSGGPGIALSSSSSNDIIGNNISNSIMAGIFITKSTNSTFKDNKMMNDGMCIQGAMIEEWNTHDIDTSNTVNGNPVYYWKNQTGGKVPSGAGQVILANSTNIIIKGQELSYTYVGIELGFSPRNYIRNNNVSSHTLGIVLSNSSENNIVNNTVSNNKKFGIGIDNSHGNNFIANNISQNNMLEGLEIYNSHKNNFIANNISQNNLYGIRLSGSSNNTFHHNHILNNTRQVRIYNTTCFNNVWDDGMGEGNYWSDYNGLDDGSNGRVAGDGVGDTEIPHPFIDQGDGYFQLDNYPLLYPVDNFLYLYEGWNLISVPFIQIDTNLGSVLSSIYGAYDAVQWYNTSDGSDPWKHHHISKPPELNDLESIDHTRGFWIHITASGGALFQYSGIRPSKNQTTDLHPGWNMVGYPSLSNRNRTEALNNLNFTTEVNSIWTYDAATLRWEEIGETDYFERGIGYWIHSLVKKTWDVPL